MTTYATHKKAHFDYEILETYEAGLMLSGTEVKSIRAGKVKLEGSHVVVRGGEVFVVGLHITAYQPSNTPKNYDPERTRKLLLDKKEIAELERQTETAGLTAIPVNIHTNKSKLKLEIAIARGKKKHDKRETIKARDTKRDIDRLLKSQ